MIQIKYETNNYYQQMPHSPNYKDMNNGQHPGRSPKASNVVIDGSVFKNNNTGFMSPQPGGPRAFDFHPPKIGRVNSPMNMTINNMQNKTSAVRKPKKSISFKSKGDQEKVSFIQLFLCFQFICLLTYLFYFHFRFGFVTIRTV